MTNDAAAPRSWLGGVHDRWGSAAGWVHDHRVAVWVVGAPAVVAILAAIHQFVLLDFPNSGDEYVYLYQARTMAAGRLWNSPIEPPAVFAFNYIVQEPGRVFGSFPIGWPLALAAVIRMGLPAWMLSPVLGALTLGLV
jgi:hypothetical protein